MYHFHVAPVGGTKAMAADFYRDRYALVSINEPSEMSVVKDTALGYILDNGAYTAWRQGRDPDFDAYTRFVVKHQTPKFMWAFIPDVIDGSPKDNDALLRDWPKGITGVPIYHMHEPIDRLVRLASDYDLVALGSSGKWMNPGTFDWWKRMSLCLAAVVDSDGIPITRLHGLRMMAPRLVVRIPFHSADSSMVGRNSATVMQRYPGYTRVRAATVLATRIERYVSASRWKPEASLF